MEGFPFKFYYGGMGGWQEGDHCISKSTDSHNSLSLLSDQGQT